MEHFKDFIKVYGAREHNLKNINLQIPKNKLTVITGPSGSGKSSLALDILFTEGKRRYMESLSSYVRQFLGIAKKPDFDKIEGLCPSIAIEQKTVGHNPRSTVGTVTEIYDYLRVLFARVGRPHCSNCGLEIKQESAETITKMVCKNFNNQKITVVAPIAVQKKGEFTHDLKELYDKGFYRLYIDGQYYKFESKEEIDNLKLKKTFKHDIDVYIDQTTISEKSSTRIQEAVEKAFQLTGSVCKIKTDDNSYTYSSSRICIKCACSFPTLEPRFFSFNSPIGACKECFGLGMHSSSWIAEELKDKSLTWQERYKIKQSYRYKEGVCSSCDGKRLNKEALSVLFGYKNIWELGNYSIKEALEFLDNVNLNEVESVIAEDLLKEIKRRLTFLFDVGLSYLTLNRMAKTLSGGEGQRIRLATQIGSALTGVLYILDEPSIGLHQRDNDKLIGTLKKLRDQGNTVVVVEHDLDTMYQSDYIVDMGPAAGILGGEVTAVGTPEEVGKNKNSLTGKYLSGEKKIEIPAKRRQAKGLIKVIGATKNNLKNVNVNIPVGTFVAVSGVSGSGKSSLIMEELVPAMQNDLIKSASRRENIVAAHADVENDHIKEMVVIDQSPIGRTPRSNPATYLGVFDEIRKLFSQLPESKVRGYEVGRFSFNVKEGRCFECSGEGVISVEMHFLADVTMQCKTCKGKRYNQKTLEIKYKDKSIADVLEMSAYEGYDFFKSHASLAKKLKLMCDVGLDYIALGQSSTTLSGGEAQRIKLVKELAKRGRDTLYVLDEPTTGLHNSDVDKLLKVLNKLVDKGNTVLIIEHNIDVLAAVDYLIDVGPEGGQEGGLIVASGTPEEVAKTNTHTARYLKKLLVK